VWLLVYQAQALVALSVLFLKPSPTKGLEKGLGQEQGWAPKAGDTVPGLEQGLGFTGGWLEPLGKGGPGGC
jgi:hypothetical protein